MNAQPDPTQAEFVRRLRNDFPFFAKTCLRIRTKSGELKPFILNRAQRRLHERMEAQLVKAGRVRAIIVKGRQVGGSTYLQARFYWRLWRALKGTALNAYILTHHDDATENLFGMAKRFQEHMPPPLRPAQSKANAKQLVFADTGCGYAVATAGGREAARSSTIQLFHGSEIPLWPNAESHVASILTTALANAPGTESVLESTARGIGNVFHRYAMAALRGDSEYELIFLPWYWAEEYRTPCPADWEAPDAWIEYGALHDLDADQVYWAFLKNRELAQAHSLPDDEPCWVFKQEYPATVEEAFQTSGNSFVPSLHIMRARKAEVIAQGPLVIGVDPARGGGDKTGVIDRRGRRIGQNVCERWDDDNTMTIAAKVAALIRKLDPKFVNIDVGGLGAGIYDRLEEMGYGYCVRAVNFGSSPLGIGPTGDELYANRRSEMWDVMRDWFGQDLSVQIPDNDVLHADLAAPEWGPGATRHNSSNALLLEPKERIRERLGFSPDLGDAAALTFAEPLNDTARGTVWREPRRGKNGRTGY